MTTEEGVPPVVTVESRALFAVLKKDTELLS